MDNLARLLTAAAACGGLAAPAAAQYQTYPQQYPEQYPQQYPQNYPGYGYGYQQGYGQNAISQIIDQLLGNRYNVTDRQAVSRCASAAVAQAQAQYGGYGGYGYQQRGYGYGQGIAAPMLRVTAITNVERRFNGLRVRGRIGTGYGGNYSQYGNQYGYQNRGYAEGDLSFRCNVDYRGTVTGLRVSPTSSYRRY